MGLSEAGIVNQRMLAVLAGKPTGSSQITASSVEPGSYEGVTG